MTDLSWALRRIFDFFFKKKTLLSKLLQFGCKYLFSNYCPIEHESLHKTSNTSVTLVSVVVVVVNNHKRNKCQQRSILAGFLSQGVLLARKGVAYTCH